MNSDVERYGYGTRRIVPRRSVVNQRVVEVKDDGDDSQRRASVCGVSVATSWRVRDTGRTRPAALAAGGGAVTLAQEDDLDPTDAREVSRALAELREQTRILSAEAESAIAQSFASRPILATEESASRARASSDATLPTGRSTAWTPNA